MDSKLSAVKEVLGLPAPDTLFNDDNADHIFIEQSLIEGYSSSEEDPFELELSAAYLKNGK